MIGASLDALLERYVVDGTVDGMAVAVAAARGPVTEHYAGLGAPGLPASPDVDAPDRSGVAPERPAVHGLDTAGEVLAPDEGWARHVRLARPVPDAVEAFALVGEQQRELAPRRQFAGERGTVVRATIAYQPPGGAIGKLVAKLFQREPRIQTRRDLKRFKQLMETGEIATAARTMKQFEEEQG